MFWFYESVFETLFNRCENTDWYDYFDNEEMGDRFMQILSDVDYEKLAHGKKNKYSTFGWSTCLLITVR